MELQRGQSVLAFTRGKWMNGVYLEAGEKEGEHYVQVGEEKRKIINDEIQVFVG
jgi:hypothetical protein